MTTPIFDMIMVSCPRLNELVRLEECESCLYHSRAPTTGGAVCCSWDGSVPGTVRFCSKDGEADGD